MRRNVAKKRDATLVVPPHENAVEWEEGHPRTEALAQIKTKGMAASKDETGYHHRSIAENAMYRLKRRWCINICNMLIPLEFLKLPTFVSC